MEPISIIAGDYPDAKDSDIVIITSGIARKPGQTRIDLAQTNVNILKSITPQIVKEAPNALYVIVSNPVDIMTYVFTKISGLPERQIIGSGTILDTARLRCGLSEKLQVAQKNIHAYVFGEHGDTSFIPWTGVYVSGIHVDEYVNVAQHMGKDVKPIDKDEMIEYVLEIRRYRDREEGSYLLCRIQIRMSALQDPAGIFRDRCDGIFHDAWRVWCGRRMFKSTLTLVGPKGISGKIPMRMNKEETKQLQASAEALEICDRTDQPVKLFLRDKERIIRL